MSTAQGLDNNLGHNPDHKIINERFAEACLFLEKREFSKAEEILLPLSELMPVNLNIHLKLIECYINLGRYVDAHRVLVVISKECPEDRAVLIVTPIVLFCLNDFNGAYNATLELNDQEREDAQIKNVIRHSIMCANFEAYSEKCERDVLSLIESKAISESEFYSIAQKVMCLKLGVGNKTLSLDMEELVNDPLLIKLLSFSYVRSPAIEQIVTTLRSKLLTISLAKMELPDNLVLLAQAISLQSFHNEYIFSTTEDEKQMISELEMMLVRLVDGGDWSPTDVEGLFLLLCMYRRLHDLSFKNELLTLKLEEWPDSLKEIVGLSLYQIEDELVWLEQVESIGVVSDEVSSKVQQQYEDHPYPRWSQLYLPAEKTCYQTYMRRNIFGYKEDRQDMGVYELLVAGCGTGFHPLSIAGSTDANVTAIDLSRRSLAYATKSASQHNMHGIKFYHMDILNVEQLNQLYDVVESVGVIHHMRDPEEGLQALLKVLKPKGYLRLGLYSSISREKLIKLRKLYVESGMDASEENIRAVRQTMLNSKSAQDVFGVVNQFADFYSMSSCRDLVFHEEEHCFTLPQIHELLDKYNLEFLGFSGLKKNVVGSFMKRHGVDNLTNLAAWDEFEKANPSTFNCMYQFMTKRKD